MSSLLNRDIRRIGNGPGSNGLGDVLLLTAICKQMPCIVQLPPKAQRFACLFDGLAVGVEITDNPVSGPNVGSDQYIRTALRALHLNVDDYLPEIIINESQDITAEMQKYDKPPIAICTDCSPYWRRLRMMHWSKWTDTFDAICEKFTPIQFGGSSSPIKLQCEHKFDLDISTLSLYYKSIGRYIGMDTGDHHLMLAVGGNNLVLCPQSTNEYDHSRWHYISPRVNYLTFDRVTKDTIIEGLNRL